MNKQYSGSLSANAIDMDKTVRLKRSRITTMFDVN